jgi:hypothetical protein
MQARTVEAHLSASLNKQSSSLLFFFVLSLVCLPLFKLHRDSLFFLTRFPLLIARCNERPLLFSRCEIIREVLWLVSCFLEEQMGREKNKGKKQEGYFGTMPCIILRKEVSRFKIVISAFF